MEWIENWTNCYIVKHKPCIAFCKSGLQGKETFLQYQNLHIYIYIYTCCCFGSFTLNLQAVFPATFIDSVIVNLWELFRH